MATGASNRPSLPRSSVVDPEAHILVVDDDGEIRQLLGRFLRQYGYRVTGAGDGRQMREALASAPVDLVVLDLMLPGTSGLDLCREIRARRSIPIIMLTAKGDDSDRIVGLELGADDYVTKPFNARELLARIRAVLRRAERSTETSRPAPHVIEFAGWLLNTRRRQLTDPAGTGVELSGGEYDLLLAFLEHPQRVLSREQLLDLARQRTAHSFDRSIDVQVSRLRRKLESDSGTELIKTVRGAGYLFVPEVTRP